MQAFILCVLKLNQQIKQFGRKTSNPAVKPNLNFRQESPVSWVKQRMWAVLMLGKMRSEQQLPVRECFLLGSVSSELGRHGAAQLEVDRAGRLSYLPPSGLICAAVSPPRPLRLRTKHFSRCREPAPGEEATTLFLGPNCERHRWAGNRGHRQTIIYRDFPAAGTIPHQYNNREYKTWTWEWETHLGESVTQTQRLKIRYFWNFIFCT